MGPRTASWRQLATAGVLIVPLALAGCALVSPGPPGGAVPSPAPVPSVTVPASPSPTLATTPTAGVSQGPAPSVGKNPTASPSVRPSTIRPSTARPTWRPTTVRPTVTRPTSIKTSSAAPTATRPTAAPTRPTASTPACSLPAGLLGRDLERLPTTRKVVAFTFDAGGSAAGVPKILATLRDKGAPATFFLTGDFVDAFPSSARAIAKYPIGNHTQDHPDLTKLSDARVRAQLATGASTIQSVTGQDPRPYFRFPYGARDARTIRLVNESCYVPFRWSVDTLGWKGTSGGQSVATVRRRVLDGLRPGAIILMHVGAHPTDHSTLDADALAGLIDEVRARGYTLVDLSETLPTTP